MFKKGDKVKVVRKFEKVSTWELSGRMDYTIGMEGEVSTPCNCNVTVVKIGDNIWTYDNECLELVEGVKTKEQLICKGGFKIRAHNEAHSKVIQERLFELDYYWEYSNKAAPDRMLLSVKKRISYWTKESSFDKCDLPEVTLDDLFKAKIHEDVEIELNDEYTAIVKKDHVSVGCQEISFDKVKEIYDAIEDSTKI